MAIAALVGTSRSVTVRLSVSASYATSGAAAEPSTVARTARIASGAMPRNVTVQSREAGMTSVAPSAGAIENCAESPSKRSAISVDAQRSLLCAAPSSSHSVKLFSAPGNTTTCSARGLATELSASPSAGICSGTIAPGLANTGMRSRSRQASRRRPSAGRDV